MVLHLAHSVIAWAIQRAGSSSFTRFDIRGRLSIHKNAVSNPLPDFTITSMCPLHSHKRLALNISAIDNNTFLPVVAHDGRNLVSGVIRYQGADQVQSAVDARSDTARRYDAQATKTQIGTL